MAHPYESHVDVRDTAGYYLGALTWVLEGRRLHVRSCDIPALPPGAHPRDPLPPVVIRELSIPLTLWTIRKCFGASVLWSERDCIVVGDRDFVVLLDAGYIVVYNQDPFVVDVKDWVADFIQLTHRRDQ